MHVRQPFFGRIITILFSGVCTLFFTISAIVPSRGSTFFSQDVYYIAHKRLPLSSLNEYYNIIAHERLPFLVWMTIVESGWNVWVWLVGVVSRRWVWLVGVGGIYGCGYCVWF